MNNYLKPKRFFSSLFTCILFLQTLHAQQNLVNGYVVTQSQDTIHGKIDYRNWLVNPKTISFHSPSGFVEYSPTEIKSFFVTNQLYYSAIVEKEISSRDIAHLDINSDLRLVPDTIFLQTLVKGSKSLYLLRDKDGIENFYVKNKEEYDLLIFKKYRGKDKGNRLYNQRVVKGDLIYVKQIQSYLNDCPNILTRQKEIKYSKKSLMEVFQNYYDCIGDNMVFKKELERTKVALGLVLGGTVTHTNFKSNTLNHHLINANFPVSLRPSIGLSLDVDFPDNRKNWSFYNEFLFTTSSTKAQNTDFVNPSFYTESDNELIFSHLKMYNLMRYRFSKRKTSFFINSGTSIGLGFFHKNVAILNKVVYTQERMETVEAVDKIRKVEFGVPIGIGLELKKYTFELRYEWSNGISNVPFLKNPINRYSLLSSYLF